MSKQLSSQATKLWQLVTAPTTAETYQKTITVTWQILKEAAILLWLAVCLVLVLFDWLGAYAVSAGRQAKDWFNNLQSSSTDQVASDTGKVLVDTAKSGFASAISLARDQLGLPEKEISPTQPKLPPASPTPAAPPKPVVAKSAAPVSESTAKVASKSTDVEDSES